MVLRTFLLLILAGSLSPAYAVPVRLPSDTAVYPRAFFNDHAPATALDIVSRVPGFRVDFGADRRGFDEAGGNVLIDGARPTAKTGGLREVLERIPADSVERVELITNPTMAAASGQTVIVNVVLRGVDGAGSWRAALTRNPDGVVSPAVRGSHTTRLGDWSVSSGIDHYAGEIPSKGDRIRRSGDGTLLLLERETRATDYAASSFSGEAARALADGDFAVNMRVGHDSVSIRYDRPGFPGPTPGNLPDQWRIDTYEAEGVNGEIGFTLGLPRADGWHLDALALARWDLREERAGSARSAPPGAFVSGVRSTTDRDSFEWIGRAVFTARDMRGWRPQFGFEAAYNRLDAALDFGNVDADGGLTPIELPSAVVIVDEWRYSPFIKASSEIRPDWTLDAGIAFEASEIAVRGGAQNSQSLHFLKPSVSLAWRTAGRPSLRATVQRKVDQLDFDRFAASTDTRADRARGGNPDLRPDRGTKLSLDIDHRVEGGRALNVALYHVWKDDVLEDIILRPGTPGELPVTGFGNAGDARAWGIDLAATSPLPFGIEVDVRVSWRGSAFDDPITGVKRPLDGISPLSYAVELRQELPARGLSWGLQASTDGVETSYFVAERSTNDKGVEHSFYFKAAVLPRLTATLTVIDGRRVRVGRDLHQPTRSAPINAREWGSFEDGPDIEIAIEGRF
jgi:hypothetical protein